MTITQLIIKLTELKKEHGDLSVHINDRYCNNIVNAKFEEQGENIVRMLPDRVVLDQY